jgi:hypothetical protein
VWRRKEIHKKAKKLHGMQHMDCNKYNIVETGKWLAHTTVGIPLIYSSKIIGAFYSIERLADFSAYS